MTMTIIIIIYLARNKKYCNKKVLSEAPVNFYFHFSIVNLCDREFLCDIRRDYDHHVVRERDFERDA